ncbi:NUDIX domain-containing protein [Nanoarchaeota archaeon]
MDYNLNHPKRRSIFQQFLYNKSLRFNEIEKLSGMRSNELAYFLQKLVDEGVVVKSGDVYVLSESAEKYIPFFVESAEKMSPLPVVLVGCVDSGRVLLWKRNKRPYEGCWGLPGGRLRLSETVRQAGVRLLKGKTFMDGVVDSINAVVNEKHSEDDELKHAYVIIFALARPLGEIKGTDSVQWFDLSALPDDMIPSDRWLVENKLNSRVELDEETINESSGKLEIRFERG